MPLRVNRLQGVEIRFEIWPTTPVPSLMTPNINLELPTSKKFLTQTLLQIFLHGVHEQWIPLKVKLCQHRPKPPSTSIHVFTHGLQIFNGFQKYFFVILAILLFL